MKNKKLLLLIGLVFYSVMGFSQIKISTMPTYTGDPSGGFVPIVINGVNRKIDAANIKGTLPVSNVTIAGLRSLSTPATSVRYYTTDTGKEGFWYYDSTDVSSTDNTGIVLVSGTKRFKRIYAGNIQAKWFGIAPDGTDQSSLLNSIISAIPANATLEFEHNLTYTCASKISLTKAVKIVGNGSAINYTGTGIAVSLQSSNIDIGGLNVNGQANTYTASYHAIATESSSNTSFYSGINIHGCSISNYKNAAIDLNYVTNFRVNDNVIRDFPYAGIMVISGTFGDISGNVINNITAATTGNGYGITVTRSQSNPNDTLSHDITITRNKIDSVILWAGIDTHGGYNLVISDNIILKCLNAISLVNQVNSTTDQHSPTFTITGNIINSEGLTTNINNGSAITIQGSDSTINGLAHGTISGNKMTGLGISLYNSRAVTISGNTFVRPRVSGITQQYRNYGTIISNNSFIDVWNNSLSNCAAIIQTSGTNKNDAFIQGNILKRGEKDTTGSISVNYYGFLNLGDSTNRATFGLNDFSVATSAQYSNIFDPTYIVGTTTPSYTAPVGSIHINKWGATSAVFYIKDNGTGSTGWIAMPSDYTLTKGFDALPPSSGSTRNSILRYDDSKSGGTLVTDFGISGTSPYAGWVQRTQSTSLGNNYPFVLNPNGGNTGVHTFNPKTQFQVTQTGSIAEPTLGTPSGGFSLLTGAENFGLYSGISAAGNTWLQAMRGDATATAYNIELNPSGGNVTLTAPATTDSSNKAVTSAFVKNVPIKASQITGVIDTSHLPQISIKTSPNLAASATGDSLFLKKRIYQVSTESTSTYNTDTIRLYVITGLTSTATFANPTGATPNDGTEIEIRLTDNGTSHSISWGTKFLGNTNIPLPTATTLGLTTVMKFEYNAVADKYYIIFKQDY